MDNGGQRREALECRYDGPVPAACRPAGDAVEALRRRLRLHRRLALEYARQAGRGAGDTVRLRRHLVGERRFHSHLARLLGEAMRRDQPPAPLVAAPGHGAPVAG